MDKFDRMLKLDRLLRARRVPMSLADIMEQLECSRASANRALGLLRDVLGADLPYDKERKGYYYRRAPDGALADLPGLWFDPAELQALIAFEQLVTRLAPGLLKEHFAPLRARIDRLMKQRRLSPSGIAQRIRVLSMAGRDPGPWFARVADVTLQRRVLRLRYVARSTDARTERDVSPQRLTHYRDCWYLDALDHLRTRESGTPQLRSFALDRIEHAEARDERAHDLDDATLDAYFADSYGIFGGVADKVAVLRFTAERARWVAAERWHPRQVARTLADGRHELEVPYAKSPELVMDILRHGPAVEVVAPQSLRDEVAAALRAAAAQYAAPASERAPRKL